MYIRRYLLYRRINHPSNHQRIGRHMVIHCLYTYDMKHTYARVEESRITEMYYIKLNRCNIVVFISKLKLE